MKLLTAVTILTISMMPVFAKSGSRGGSHKSSSGDGHVKVKSYDKKNGTHVDAHERSKPNKTETDNWSTKGNENPHTGKEGTKDAKK